MTPQDALKSAILILGGPTATGNAVGVSKQAVQQWDVCPEDRVQALAEAVRGVRAVPAPTEHDLRPDLFPKRRKR